jgi:hypothetical protein
MCVLRKNKCFRLIPRIQNIQYSNIHQAQNVLWNPKMNPTQKWLLYNGIWNVSKSLKNTLTGNGVSYSSTQQDILQPNAMPVLNHKI